MKAFEGLGTAFDRGVKSALGMPQDEQVAATKANTKRMELDNEIRKAQADRIARDFELGDSMVKNFQSRVNAINQSDSTEVQKVDAYQSLVAETINSTPPRVYAERIGPMVSEMMKLSRYRQAEKMHADANATKAKWSIQFGNSMPPPITPSGAIDPAGAAMAFRFAELFPGEMLPSVTDVQEGTVRTRPDLVSIRDRIKGHSAEMSKQAAEIEGLNAAAKERGRMKGAMEATGTMDMSDPLSAVKMSARNKDTPDGTTLERYRKFDTIINSLDELNTELNATSTGPIKGRIEKIQEMVLGDSDHTKINAMVNGLVPNVARSVFGEVGVLTDSDIRNYKRILADPTLSNRANLMLVDMLKKKVAEAGIGLLHTQARGGKNVSAFAGDISKFQQLFDGNQGVSSNTANEVFSVSLEQLQD